MPTSLHFAREPLTDALWDEALPLLVKHWDEIHGHAAGAPLAPDLAKYEQMATAGILRVFTARVQECSDPPEEGTLVGYATFTLTASVHCRDLMEAQQDAIYMRQKERMQHGAAFLRFCAEMVFEDGAQVCYQFTPIDHDFGPVLLRHGFEEIGTMYAKVAPRPVAVLA